jgi:hypothetical protein
MVTKKINRGFLFNQRINLVVFLIISLFSPPAPAQASSFDLPDSTLQTTNDATVSSINNSSQVAANDGRPVQPAGTNDFTLVALPDTQKYATDFPDIFYKQTQWIVDNRAAQNIVFVTHLGDLVDDWNVPSQWDVANTAMTKLDTAGIPYGFSLGNTDSYAYGNLNGGTSLYNNYFPASRFTGRSYFGGTYNGDISNSYQLFSAGGMDFVVIHVAYNTNPDPAIPTWADHLLQNYSSRRGIIVIHYLTDTNNNFGPQAAALLQKVKARPNLFLMLGGHLPTEGMRQDPGDDGHTIYSLRTDFQYETNGGNGYLRLLRFSPANNKIYVKTYSPSLNQFETDADSQFEMDYAMGSGAQNNEPDQNIPEVAPQPVNRPLYTGNIPTFSIVGVNADNHVTIRTNNFPPNLDFTVRLGCYGSLGIGGFVVATTNSGTGGVFEATYNIPEVLKGNKRIAIRLESGSTGYYAYNWFWNNTTGGTGSGTGGVPAAYQGVPTFTVSSVSRDNHVTILTNNLPPNQDFTVRIGAYGTAALGGVVVNTFNSGSGGSQSLTYDIPEFLKGSVKIAIRMDSSLGYFAYNWFWNNSTN